MLVITPDRGNIPSPAQRPTQNKTNERTKNANLVYTAAVIDQIMPAFRTVALCHSI
ncbi:hypothetical protein OIDMADRAFT_18002 [Oidiodendron maius Zn]|uniref:Uncharacterized protein n=1 Tax=Oidiodendron maius (strain Zn) TaxID=913774 RepID=A0A0C3H6D1_OIDMZ|nr:hypothetical protein OIDMADRAFT_18002 [Oidiodendron maius Zn]